MLLPGRLRATTLGDLFGTIHRARATGTLELTEDSGRSHRIHWTEGRIVAVEAHGMMPAITLRRQFVQSLQKLDMVADAQVRFRVAVRTPAAKLREPLAPTDFLHGRRRARDASKTPPPTAIGTPRIPERSAALYSLGLTPGADAATIKQTYRRLVRAYHPDLHPDATDAERRRLAERFSAVTEAYQRLLSFMIPVPA